MEIPTSSGNNLSYYDRELLKVKTDYDEELLKVKTEPRSDGEDHSLCRKDQGKDSRKKSFRRNSARKKELLRHLNLLSGKNKEQLRHLKLQIGKKKKLLRQQKLHNGKKLFSCSKCSKGFVQKSQYLSHQKTHWKKKRFSCHECGKGFNSEKGLKDHQKCHATPAEFYCNICSGAFSRETDLLKHRQVHIKIRPLFPLLTHRQVHVKIRPLFPSNAEENESSDCDDLFACNSLDGCGSWFSVKSGITDFTEDDGDGGEMCYGCPQCGRVLSFVMKSGNSLGNFDKSWCEKCGASYGGLGCSNAECQLVSENLDGENVDDGGNVFHFETNTEFDCSVGEGFVRKSQYPSHQKTRGKKKPFSCHECGKGFKCKKGLRDHQKWHATRDTSHEEFDCNLCGEAFSQETDLLTHREVHTKIRPLFPNNPEERSTVKKGDDIFACNSLDGCGCWFWVKSGITDSTEDNGDGGEMYNVDGGEMCYGCPQCGSVLFVVMKIW